MADNYCNKCGKCCEKIAVDFEKKVVYRDGIQPLSDYFADMLIKCEQKENITFCKCKYLRKSVCINMNKPEECTNYPSSPFAFLSGNCGYEGVIFMKLESAKQKVRRFKEEIVHYNALIQSGIHRDEARQYQKIIASHQGFIDKFKIYGSENW